MHGTGCDEARSQYALRTLSYALSTVEPLITHTFSHPDSFLLFSASHL